MRKFLLMFLLVASSIFARVIEVPADYSGIQLAIAASANGDSIIVARGTYNESIDFLGKSIVIASQFANTRDTADISNTIIDAAGNHPHVVKFVNREGRDSKLIGLSITGGLANGTDEDNKGAGIYCNQEFENLQEVGPHVSNCYIYGNTANKDGAGIGAIGFASSMLIENCKIYNNTALHAGGGIFLGSMKFPTIVKNCDIYNNTAKDGGGFVSFMRNNMVEGCKIYSNKATKNGSAFRAIFGFKLNKALIYDNGPDTISVIDAAAFMNPDGVKPVIITNSTITNNAVSDSSKTIFISSLAKMVIVNSVIDNNATVELTTGGAQSEIEIAYSNINGGESACVITTGNTLNWQNNNISSNPMFTDFSENDYTLQTGSPCIDAGTATYNYGGEAILALNSSNYNGNAPDMGCFEYERQNATEDHNIIVNDMQLSNYPNPFNPETTVSFDLPKPAYVELSICNIKGQVVKNLVAKDMTEGKHNVVWNGQDDNGNSISSGVYLYKLNTKSGSQIKRMLLLK